jgi:hypothetical protein
MGAFDNFGFVASQHFSRFLSGWVQRTTAHSVPTERNGMRMLRYHGANAVTGWCGVLFSAGMLIGSACVEVAAVRWFGVLVSGVMACFSAWLILLVRRSVVIYGGDEIHYFPIDGAAVSFSWGDVVSVEWSPTSSAWFIELGDGRKARVGSSMHGGLEFIETLQRQTGIVPEMPD